MKKKNANPKARQEFCDKKIILKLTVLLIFLFTSFEFDQPKIPFGYNWFFLERRQVIALLV